MSVTAPRIELGAGATVSYGDDPKITLRGRPGDTLTIRAFRQAIVARDDSPTAHRDTVVYEAWGAWRVPRDGTVHVGATVPLAGTWHVADPLGLFWSMGPRDAAASRTVLPPRRGELVVLLEAHNAIVDSARVRLQISQRALREEIVVQPGLVGAYAAPSGSVRRPAILLLHGSEGGDTTSARQLARRFAERGYAAFAVVYVAYAYATPFAGVPNSFVDIPVETLDHARQWMGAHLEADTARTTIWGVSKGAEFALVAASRRRWPAAVIACVPSDVVWAGFGAPVPEGQVPSSWSDNGVSLSAIAYDRYEDVFTGRATSRQVHDRSRVLAGETARGARIAVESILAPLLLLGSDADEVWASGPMARTILETMKRAGLASSVTIETFPSASHGICGDGTTAWPRYAPLDEKTSRATAEANARAWQRTRAFLVRQFGQER